MEGGLDPVTREERQQMKAAVRDLVTKEPGHRITKRAPYAVELSKYGSLGKARKVRLTITEFGNLYKKELQRSH
jgi:hypothetical protein